MTHHLAQSKPDASIQMDMVEIVQLLTSRKESKHIFDLAFAGDNRAQDLFLAIHNDTFEDDASEFLHYINGKAGAGATFALSKLSA